MRIGSTCATSRCWLDDGWPDPLFLDELCAWTTFVVSGAQYSQSTVRRFRRWLANDKMEAQTLYGRSCNRFGGLVWQTAYVALDTSMLWNTYCMVRLSVIYGGWEIPWCGVSGTWQRHGGYEVIRSCWKGGACSRACRWCFWRRWLCGHAAAGYLSRLGWHFRMRIKSNFWVYGPGALRFRLAYRVGGPRAVLASRVAHGQILWSVHLAVLGIGLDVYWAVISDERTEVETLQEYGLRFDIEENFLDDKSNGLQLESSLIRSAKALERCVSSWR